MPILLEQLTKPKDLSTSSKENFINSWNLLNLSNEHMPVISPGLPEQNIAFNTNEFTRELIVKEMKNGVNY